MVDDGGDHKETNNHLIQGRRICQTNEARWMCIEEIYEKMYRPNFYDIGGTFIQDLADYWFTCKIEVVGTNFLLHLFVRNRQESSYFIMLSDGNDITLDKKNNIAYLSSYLKEFEIHKAEELTETYITTYFFTDVDVETMKDKVLYIGVKFPLASTFRQEIIDNIKAAYDFGDLLSDPIGSDFTIESMDGEKFQVHKALLTAHSEVFKAMLKEETAESMNNYVKLIDVSAEDLQSILQFIYTGTVKDIEECNSINLLMVADKYDLIGLRHLAEYALREQINLENAFETLTVADMYNSNSLKTAALKYIKKNPKVLKSSAFKEILNADLVREVCRFIVPS